MNLRLFSLTWQNEHFTHNSVAMKSTVSKLMRMLKGIPRNPLKISQYIRDIANSLKKAVSETSPLSPVTFP